MEAADLERCIATAKAAGSPKDQVERFLPLGYVPMPWQWKVHAAAREADRPNGPVRIGIGGARGPGKTHAIFAQGTLDDSQRVDNLKGLFLRKTGKAAKESMEDLVAKVLAGKLQYEYKNSSIHFPNGSRVILGGFKDDKDIDNYVGQEYDWVAVEEGNQLTAEKKKLLRGSLRTSKEGWRPRWYETFNPGGVGHGDVKATYVLPYRNSIETSTRFVPATYRDNPNLNQEYLDYLEGLDGQLGRAWREGDFDILAGQYFSEWRHDIHVCPPFGLSPDFRRFCALDYGYTHPAALGWFAVGYDGELYLYRELVESQLTGSALGERFVEMTPSTEKIEYIEADPSFWARRGEDDGALSAAEKFQRRVQELLKNAQHKCPPLKRANNDRIPGWLEVHERLKPYERDNRLTAGLQVFSTCPKTIEAIPLMVHDENNPEDVEKQDGDDPPDMVRYGVMSDPQPTISREAKATLEWKRAMKRNQGRSTTRLKFVQ